MDYNDLKELLKDNSEAIAFIEGQNQKVEEAIANSNKLSEKVSTYESELEKVREVKESLEKSNKTLKTNIRKAFNLDDDAPTGEEDLNKYITGLVGEDVKALKDKFNKEKDELIREIQNKTESKFKSQIETLDNELHTYKKTLTEKEKSEKFNEFFNELVSIGFKKDEASIANLRAIAEVEFSKTIEKVGDEWGVFSVVGDSKVKDKDIGEFVQEFANSPGVQINKEATSKSGAMAQPPKQNNASGEEAEAEAIARYKQAIGQ